MKRAVLSVGLLYVFVLLLSGFFLHRAVATDTFITIDDYHYGVVMGSALRIALGEAASVLRINFGLLSTLSAGLLARLFAIDSFAGWIRLIQSFQVLSYSVPSFRLWHFSVIAAWCGSCFLSACLLRPLSVLSCSRPITPASVISDSLCCRWL